MAGTVVMLDLLYHSNWWTTAGHLLMDHVGHRNMSNRPRLRMLYHVEYGNLLSRVDQAGHRRLHHVWSLVGHWSMARVGQLVWKMCHGRLCNIGKWRLTNITNRIVLLMSYKSCLVLGRIPNGAYL